MPADPAHPIETPLSPLHLQEGAQLASWFGSALPNHFGDWLREYWFAHNSVALIDKNYRAYFSFTGPDRVRYLNAILTNNIKDLPQNHGIVSLLLNPQGHIVAEIETYALPDTLFCVSYNLLRDRLLQTLDKYIIMDDVTLTDQTARYGSLALEGPHAARIAHELTGLDLATFAELGRQDASVASIPCSIVRRSPGEFVGAEFLTERRHLESLWRILKEKALAAGGGPVGYLALNALRLEQGVPWFSYDFGEKQIPHEAALELSHISYTKGCYTGQEIVERVRSRGQVHRRRVSLLFTGDTPPPNEPLLSDAKEAGYVTRAAFSPLLSRPVGMGYVRKESIAPGTVLEWKRGTATVSVFPEKLPGDTAKTEPARTKATKT